MMPAFDMNLPSVTTCGSGVTAAGLTLALAILGKTDIRLFDGSGHNGAPLTPLLHEFFKKGGMVAPVNDRGFGSGTIWFYLIAGC